MAIHEPVSLAINRKFRAPVAQIYAAFTQSQLVSKWLSPGELRVARAVVDAREGGEFMVDMLSGEGEHYVTRGIYKEVIPEQRIVHTWRWDGSEVETLVTVEFREVEPGTTELTLIHDLFADAEMRDKHNSGWEGCLLKLAQLYPTA
jgi:uncharacterized protein YndB with AHSA1/START domain